MSQKWKWNDNEWKRVMDSCWEITAWLVDADLGVCGMDDLFFIGQKKWQIIRAFLYQLQILLKKELPQAVKILHHSEQQSILCSR